MKQTFLLTARCLLPLLLIIAAAGCSGSGNEPPKWLFLITLDTTRADSIDYSPGNKHTPNLAALAANGQYFQNAWALIPITLPSHSSMFYSRPPHQLKVYNNGQARKIPRPAVTQLLKANGYSTGAVISLGVLKGDFGLNKGFDRYIENFQPNLWIKDAAEVNRDAFELIDSALEKEDMERFFAWLHYSDPHEPYFPAHNADTGRFRIFLDDEEVFRSYCTAYPTVAITFDVKPGTHRLTLDSEIPEHFNDFKGFKLDYIKYRDFSLKPVNGSKNRNPDAPSPVKITVPEDWNKKREKGTEKRTLNYYSNNFRSDIVLENTAKETVSMQLRLIYYSHPDRHTRKMFYREEVRYMDEKLGELMAFLKEKGIYDESVFVIIGDHGEGMGEHKEQFGHIHYLTPPVMKVPFILSGKGIPRKGKRNELVSALNVAPTILDLTNIKKPDYMLGHSLLKTFPKTKLLLETYSPEAFFDAFSIIEYPYQVIFYPGRRKAKLEFFDLESGNYVEGARGERAERARVQLINSITKLSRTLTAIKGKVGKASKRHEEILKSLGYL